MEPSSSWAEYLLQVSISLTPLSINHTQFLRRLEPRLYSGEQIPRTLLPSGSACQSGFSGEQHTAQELSITE